jgi:tRNA dimethylallyltransferase
VRGECTLEEASETLKTATRRYAKRQCTWFGAKSYVEHIDIEGDPDEKTFKKIVKKAKKVFLFS